MHFYYSMDEWELYDLEADPNEMNNIYEEAPELLVNELKAELDSIREFYQDDQTLDEMKLMTDTVIMRVYNEPMKDKK
jgi:histidinol dehydrogenase